jgi:selenocysteine lyase/cysteine desulfurase
MKKSLEEIRRDTPACGERVHLNNAGTALAPELVTNTVLEHLRLEQTIGGYEAEAAQASALDRVYQSLANLVGAKATEIAITQNATRAWDQIFHAIPLAKGDKILTCRCEYASNYIAFLQRRKQTGAEIVVLENDSEGAVCPKSLERHLDDRVKLVAVNHIPTNGGLVQPVEELGRTLRGHPAFFLVDACQSVGQIPIDVKTMGCHALTATGRKYLRGPRGVGFLFICESKLRSLEPPFLDLHSATWVEPDRYEIRDDAKRFETYELFVAGKLGLGAAADYALSVGVQEGWERLQSLAQQARQGLSALEGIQVHDLGTTKGGIVTFTVACKEPQEVRQKLYDRKTNVWTCTVRSARLDMEARDLTEVVRASFHYYNTEDEVNTLVEQVGELSRSQV